MGAGDHYVPVEVFCARGDGHLNPDRRGSRDKRMGFESFEGWSHDLTWGVKVRELGPDSFALAHHKAGSPETFPRANFTLT